MSFLLDWIDDRTGLTTALKNCREATVPGGARWRYVWPCTLVFAFTVQVITGLFLWMLYSPSAQTAWESVYYLQYEVQGGWLLRGIHHYSAQVTLVLVGVYLVQMILTGSYRAPREFVFWVVVLMGMVVLALMLTGDLLAWDQNSYWATQVRTKFLTLLPGVGGGLYRLAAGGPAFGHLTLTRFFALHAGVFSAAFLALLVLHGWLVRRAAAKDAPKTPGSSYWPGQAMRNVLVCLVVLAVVLGLTLQHGTSCEDGGVALGAPADPADAYAAARPEWAFLGLYEFSNMFPGELKILPIFVIPGALVCVVFLMPFLGRHAAGHAFNMIFVGFLLIALVALSLRSLAHDRDNKNHQAALAAGRQQSLRVKQLARAPDGIPVGGALTLLRNDPKTQGPKLFKQHCAGCHDCVDADGNGIKAEEVSAPNLFGYAGRRWVVGFLDPEKIRSDDYFGATNLRNGDMANFVKESFSDMEKEDEEDRETIVMALSAESHLPSQAEIDKRDTERIQEGKELMTDYFGCTDCHKFHDKGQLGGAPDLTGYGSREWTVAIISNPAHKRFYGDGNDRMPAYAEDTDQPANNILGSRDIELLADWLRGDWYEPSNSQQ